MDAPPIRGIGSNEGDTGKQSEGYQLPASECPPVLVQVC